MSQNIAKKDDVVVFNLVKLIIKLKKLLKSQIIILFVISKNFICVVVEQREIT